MGILVQKVRVENFRSLKNIEVELTPLTLLVGVNNAGKTSFLKALNLALGVEKRGVNRDDLFIDKTGKTLSDNDPKQQDKIIVDVKIIPFEAGVRTNEFDEKWLAEFGNSIQYEGKQAFFAFRFQYQFGKGKDDAKPGWFSISNWASPRINEENDTLNTATLKSINLYFIDAQRDIQDDLKNRTSYFGRLATQIEYEPGALAVLEGNLASLNEDAVEKAEVLKQLKTVLKEINTPLQAGGKGVEITPLPKKIRDLHKSMKIHFQDGESEVFGLEYHGMGTRSWASMLTFKAFVGWEGTRQNTFYPLLALEEPEAHLHPNAQRHLYSQLSSTEGQKIISTHSPYIAAQATLEEIRYFCKTGDETVVKGLDLSGLSSDEKRKIKREIMLSQGELLFSKAAVLFEGETEEQALPIFAATFWKKEPFELGVNLVSCGGSKYKALLKILKSLDISWFLLSDYDTPETQKTVNSALTNIGVNATDSRVVCLEKPFEDYLMEEGYSDELRNTCSSFIEEYFSREEMRTQKRGEITDDAGLLSFLKQYKTKLSPLYATEITLLSEHRNIPTKIRNLFKEIDKKIKPHHADNSAENKVKP